MLKKQLDREEYIKKGNAYLDSVYTLSLDEDENKMVATWISSSYDDACLQVQHHLQLLFGVSGTHGDSHGSNPFRSALKTDPRGPEPIARCDLYAVTPVNPGETQTPGHHICKSIHIIFGIRDNGRLSGGPGGGMDADDLLFFRCLHIFDGVFPQFLLYCKGNVGKICEGLDILRFQTGRLELITVKTALSINTLD